MSLNLLIYLLDQLLHIKPIIQSPVIFILLVWGKEKQLDLSRGFWCIELDRLNGKGSSVLSNPLQLARSMRCFLSIINKQGFHVAGSAALDVSVKYQLSARKCHCEFSRHMTSALCIRVFLCFLALINVSYVTEFVPKTDTNSAQKGDWGSDAGSVWQRVQLGP